MKKIGIVLAIIVVGLTFIVGCPTAHPAADSGAQKSVAAAPPKTYSVDVSALPAKRNAKAFAKRNDDFLIEFPKFPVDVTQYKRVTINAKYFDAAGKEIAQKDNQAQVTLIYDPKGDIRGPEMSSGDNTPLKEFNVGGPSGLVNLDKGVRVNLKQQPGAILFQNSDANVKFIEVTQITFHNGTASD